jgi:cysteine desulfurase
LIYLDHNATTPVHPEVLKEMEPFFSRDFGNSSSAHVFGKRPKEKKEEARARVAALLGCAPGEVVFTSGGTESDNAAIKGAVFASDGRGPHVITTAVEHHAVLHTCRYLEERFGCEVTYLPVDEYGRVEPARVAEAMNPRTVLVTVMMANNETGTLNDLAAVGRIARERGVLFHTDAVQAVGKVPISVGDLGIDLLSLSGHKIYGPKGIGALYVGSGVKIDPYVHGGGHEEGRRAGTENIPGIVGLGMAAEVAANGLEERSAKLTKVRDYLWERIREEIPDVQLNGHPEERLPNTANISFPRIEGESAMMMLDTRSIALSTGSACSSEDLEPSHVLTAMGVSGLDARGALRFSFGREGSREEVDAVMEVLPGIIERLRSMSPL